MQNRKTSRLTRQSHKTLKEKLTKVGHKPDSAAFQAMEQQMLS